MGSRFQPAIYAIDFGTTNSLLAAASRDAVHAPIALDPGARDPTILRSVLYFPDATRILDRPVYRTVREVPGPVDMVDVFRRPRDIPPHVDDILAALPRVVWLQLGIRHDEAAETFARAGIQVVQDRCLLVEHRRLR